jgi:hypothetical protein
MQNIIVSEKNINNFEKYNKLFLYKKGLVKFIDLQINQDKKWNIAKHNLCNKLNNIDYIIGILFLTEMNRYCKINDISIHGYYITCALINLFLDIKNKLMYGKEISTESIIFLFYNISNNIEYLNSRVDKNNKIKKKINENLLYLILEITPLLNDIVYYKKVHQSSNSDIDNVWNIHNIEDNTNIEENNSKGICNKKCYCCWVNEILTKFIYILLIIAKYMGSGQVKEPNLYKLAEYYSNIFYVILKLDCITDFNTITEKFYQNIYINYQDYKSKLIYSIMELQINSDTIDEIIKFLDTYITNKFLQISLT